MVCLRRTKGVSMSWVEITDYQYPRGWVDGADPSESARSCCRKLEEGQILFFGGTPFDLPDEDRQFLLGQKQSDFKGHKNISYRPTQDLMRGAGGTQQETDRLH